ncbi:MAG: hypothetical protein BWK79_19310 [Beggiatoa sp. IS2]|nr:MAG: hypothetical protein BWK79_19310 [Beggiatoa sp. IS2]
MREKPIEPPGQVGNANSNAGGNSANAPGQTSTTPPGQIGNTNSNAGENSANAPGQTSALPPGHKWVMRTAMPEEILRVRPVKRVIQTVMRAGMLCQ